MRPRFTKHKFKAKPVKDDEHHFPSKLEWAYYNRLKVLQQAGHVLFFLRQVPFHLPGGVKYVIDFVEFHASGDVRFTDVKGLETNEFIAKKKMVEALYPVTIDVVKRENFKRA
jgi:hypothetical protein